MSDTKRYTPSMKVGHMVKDSDGLWIRSQDYDTTLSQLAALREELATVQRGKDNADLALTTQTKNKDRYKQRSIEAEQRLADAERRNAELVELLRDVRDMPIGGSIPGSRIDAALNPNPEAASHDE